MVTFLMILSGLIAINFILLKYSTQSVDKKIKISKKRNIAKTPSYNNAKETEIAKAA